MTDLTYGRGTYEQFEEYLELINLVFGYTNTVNSFDLLLPKLYQPELMPAYNSFNAYKDGKMRFGGTVSFDYFESSEAEEVTGERQTIKTDISLVCFYEAFEDNLD